MSEHVYCVAITFKMTEQVEQWICIKFCFKLGHSSVETTRMVLKATAMGKQFFDETSKHAGDSAPLQPDLAPCDF